MFNSMIGHAISVIRRQRGMNQQELAKQTGIGRQSLISNIENGQIKVLSLFKIIKICACMSVSVDDVISIIYAQLDENDEQKSEFRTWIDIYLKQVKSNTIDSSQEITDKQISRLKLYSDKHYKVFYIHYDRNEKSKLSSLDIVTGKEVDKGYCPFSMNISGKKTKYIGKIYSPIGNSYTYFYFSGGVKIEQGLIILYHPEGLEEPYQCGGGIMLSIDRISFNPILQRVKIIEKTLEEKIGEKDLTESLAKDITNDRKGIVSFSELMEEHKLFFEKYVE